MSDQSSGEEVSTWLGNLKKVWGLLCSALPVLIVALFDHEETKINRLKLDNEALQLQIKLKDNKDAVEQRYADMSDESIVRQSISDATSDESAKNNSSEKVLPNSQKG